MGQSMLSTASDQTAKTTFDERYENGQDQLVFRMLQLNHNLGSECITPEPGTRGQWKWATYIAEQGLIRNTRDAAHFNTATRSGFQRALIRELVEGYYKAFVWHFKLTAKSRNRLLGVQSGHLLYKSLEK